MEKIYIIGYGKMGHAIEKACIERNIACIPIDDYTTLEKTDFTKGDVAIEFTHSPDCIKNYALLIAKGVSVIAGTTGWLDKEDIVKKQVSDHNGAFLHASNFSIGVHLFWRIVERAAVLFDKQAQYDIFAHEIHHPHKKDSPSGTALHTAHILLDRIGRKTTLLSGDAEGPLPPDALHVSASRGGFQAGEHTVYFDGPDDTVSITHHAKGRAGFANGALDCALWLRGKTGYFTIDDYLEDILS